MLRPPCPQLKNLRASILLERLWLTGGTLVFQCSVLGSDFCPNQAIKKPWIYYHKSNKTVAEPPLNSSRFSETDQGTYTSLCNKAEIKSRGLVLSSSNPERNYPCPDLRESPRSRRLAHGGLSSQALQEVSAVFWGVRLPMKFQGWRGRGGYCTNNQENRLLRKKAPEVCLLFSIKFFSPCSFLFKKLL